MKHMPSASLIELIDAGKAAGLPKRTVINVTLPWGTLGRAEYNVLDVTAKLALEGTGPALSLAATRFCPINWLG